MQLASRSRLHYFCHKYLSVRACPLLERGQGTSPKIQSLAQAGQGAGCPAESVCPYCPSALTGGWGCLSKHTLAKFKY